MPLDAPVITASKPLVMAHGLFVNLAAMGDPRHADQFRVVVDNIQHPPVTDAHAPLIFIAFELLASCWSWGVGERFQLADYT